MAVSYEGYSLDYADNVTSIVLPTPVGITPGELMVVHICKRGYNKVITPPAGWNELLDKADDNNTIRTGIYYRIAEVDEPPNYTWSWLVGVEVFGAMIHLDGVNSSVPVGDFSDSSGDDASPVALSITTPSDNSILLCFAGTNTDTEGFTPPGGMAEIYDSSVYDEIAVSGVYVAVSAGATGNKTFTLDGGANPWFTVSLVISPSVGVPIFIHHYKQAGGL